MIRVHSSLVVDNRPICIRRFSFEYAHTYIKLNSTRFLRCTGQASTVFYCLRFHVALSINSGGVLDTRRLVCPSYLECFLLAITQRVVCCDMISSILQLFIQQIYICCSIRIFILLSKTGCFHFADAHTQRSKYGAPFVFILMSVNFL